MRRRSGQALLKWIEKYGHRAEKPQPDLRERTFQSREPVHAMVRRLAMGEVYPDLMPVRRPVEWCRSRCDRETVFEVVKEETLGLGMVPVPVQLEQRRRCGPALKAVGREPVVRREEGR